MFTPGSANFLKMLKLHLKVFTLTLKLRVIHFSHNMVINFLIDSDVAKFFGILNVVMKYFIPITIIGFTYLGMFVFCLFC